MIKDLKTGDKIALFFNAGNPNNKIMHVRAIIDDDYIAFKVWSKRKQRWNYFIEHEIFLTINKEYITVKKEKKS